VPEEPTTSHDDAGTDPEQPTAAPKATAGDASTAEVDEVPISGGDQVSADDKDRVSSSASSSQLSDSQEPQEIESPVELEETAENPAAATGQQELAGSQEPQEGEAPTRPHAGQETPTSTTGLHNLPDMSPEAFAKRMLELERRRDHQRNKETRPPDDEAITFRSVTIAKVYVGQEADPLAAFLNAVEWKDFDDRIAEGMTAARKAGAYYSARFTLVSDPTPRQEFLRCGKANMPAGFQRIFGQVYVLGPSLVALVFTFAITDFEAGRLDRALRDDAESTVVRTGLRQFTPKTVFHVKAELVRRLRDELGERCLAWLEEKVPGTLAAGGGHVLPMCSLISLAKGKPFWTQAEYTRLLDLTSVLYAGKFAYPDYLFLTRPMGSTREREFIAAFNEEDALSPGSYPDLFAAPEIVHEVISPVMVVEAIEGVIESFDSRMRDIRSDLEKLDFDKATDSQVIGLRNKLLGLSRDIAVVCGDATVLVDMGLIWPDYPLFISVDPSQRPLPLPDGESAADVTRRNLRSLIKNIQAQETGLRELTLITSQSISDANDTKLQTNVLTLTDKLSRLTVWLVVLTGVVVFFTLALVGIGLYQIFSPPSGTGSPSPTPSVSTPATQAPPRPTPSTTASERRR